MSACIGASAAGGRAYTATASQGLLFMAEALPNASGLRLPDRDDRGQPCARRAHQHLERPLRRDVAARRRLDPAVRRQSNQEAVDLHVQAFALAERLSVPVMVCMDGFVLTHAMEAIDVPEQEQVDALLPPFRPLQCSTPTPRSRSARWWGPRPSPRSSTSRRTASSGPSTPSATSRGRVPRGRRARLRRSGVVVPARGRRRGRRRARLGARRRGRRGRRPPRRGHPGRHPRRHLLPALAARRGARGARGRLAGRRRSTGPSPSAPAASSARTCGWRSPASRPGCTTWSSGSVADRSPGRACAGSSTTCSRDGSPTACSPSPTSTSTWSRRELAREYGETTATMQLEGR